MNILGISAHYHDSAAALVIDGLPVCAVQEERLSRRKNDPAFPLGAISGALSARASNRMRLTQWFSTSARCESSIES